MLLRTAEPEPGEQRKTPTRNVQKRVPIEASSLEWAVVLTLRIPEEGKFTVALA
jgi:hypothetical protein